MTALSKIRENLRTWYVPSVDGQTRARIYETEKQCLNYAMRHAAVSCGTIKVTDAPVENLLRALEKAIEQRNAYAEAMAVALYDGIFHNKRETTHRLEKLIKTSEPDAEIERMLSGGE